METTTDVNPYEGIEYIAFTRQFAAFTNKWPPFPERNLIGSFESLEEAVQARAAALKAKIYRNRAYEKATIY
jgi:hypothetical protein